LKNVQAVNSYLNLNPKCNNHKLSPEFNQVLENSHKYVRQWHPCKSFSITIHF